MLNLTYRHSEMQAEQPNSTGSYFRHAYFNTINPYFFLTKLPPQNSLLQHRSRERGYHPHFRDEETDMCRPQGGGRSRIFLTHGRLRSSHKELPQSAKCSLWVPREGGAESLQTGPVPSQKDSWINMHWGDMMSRLT